MRGGSSRAHRVTAVFEHVEWDELGDCEFFEGVW